MVATAAETRKWTNGPAASGRVRLTLIGGQTDESLTTSGTGTPSVSADTVNFKIGTQGWKLTMAGAGTATFSLNPPSSPFTPVMPIGAIGMWVYIPDITNITQVQANLNGSHGSWNGTLGSSSVPALANGWNLIRFHAASSTIAALSAVTSFRIIVVATGPTNVTIGHLFAECSPKAQLIVTSDTTYGSTFATPDGSQAGVSPGGIAFVGGYPDLKALGVPVVLAIETGDVGKNTGLYAPPADRSPWSVLNALMADGNGNEMNYHGSSGTASAAMTSAQIVTECTTAIKALQANGYPTPAVKACWSENHAVNAAAAQPFHRAYGSPTQQSGTPVTCWPPPDRWNFNRYALSGVSSQAQFDTDFANLQATHGVMNAYLHGVNIAGVTGGFDFVTPALWGYFLDKVSAGLAAGWLEAVTNNDLLARSGEKELQGMSGEERIGYLTSDGQFQTARLL